MRASRKLRGSSAALAAIVAYNAWYLRGELNPASYPHDGSFHLAYVRWAVERLGSFNSPLDGIFGDLGMGYPLFQHYQVLPHLLAAPFGLVFGTKLVYVALFYLLLVLWPVCLYWSVRLMEFPRAVAAGAAVASTFVMSEPGYGFELPSYVWRGHGMWAQAFGQWLFALAVAFAWRAIFRGRSLALAAAVLAALFCSHMLTGIWLVCFVAVWPLFGSKPRRVLFGRMAAVVGGACLASAWLLVPAFVDREATSMANPDGTFWRDSFGPGKVSSWLASGEIFDQGRPPVLTYVAAVGLLACLIRIRRSESYRALFVLFTVSLLMFFGTPVVGPLFDRLPAREVLFLHRTIVGVHYGGLLLFGVGAAALIRLASVLLSRLPLDRLADGLKVRSSVVAGAATAGLCVWAMAPAWQQFGPYFEEQDDWIATQHAAEEQDGKDFEALAHQARAGGGRVYAGSASDWGKDYRIGHVPAYIQVLNVETPGVGFTGRIPSLTEPSETRFDSNSTAQLEVFDVRWQIRPNNVEGPPYATLVAQRGRHNLWRTSVESPPAPLQIGDSTPVNVAAKTNDGASADFLWTDQALHGRYPLLRLPGTRTVSPTSASAESGSVHVGRIANAKMLEGGNVIKGTVEANRRGIVVAKTSTHPRWSAEVDGKVVPLSTVAPGLLAIEVPAGVHEVELRFVGFPLIWRLILIALAAATLLTLHRRRQHTKLRQFPPL